MHRCARHCCGVPTLVRIVIVSLVTLGIMAGGPGLRHASASLGCDIINSQPSQNGFQFQLTSAFDAGDVVSVTATDPHTGTPNSVVIFVDNALANVASFPGTATFALPTGGVAVAVKGGVDAGTALLDFNCIAAPPTATPTETATSTATSTSTATASRTATNTATPTATPVPEGGACMDTAQCELPLSCIDEVCTPPPAPAPALTSTALVVAVMLLAAIAGVGVWRRR